VKARTLLTALHTKFPEYTRDELFAFVACGDVTVDGECVRDTTRTVATDANVRIQEKRGFVSRGGEKLDHALRRWKLPVAGKVMIDAGASTGGFTDCLLRHGAGAVHAVDVGYNQLDYRLRTDARVRSHERANIMSMDRSDFDPPADAAVADLSFRSLSLAARHIVGLTAEGWLVALAKPQFEMRRPEAGFDGVIRDPAVVESVLVALLEELSGEGLSVRGVTASPIRGRKGNREFLLWLARAGHDSVVDPTQTADGNLRQLARLAVQENESGPIGFPM